MELDSRKKSRRNRMMHSISFDTQEVKDIGRKEAGESRGFPILWMGIIEDVFKIKEMECKVLERLKIRKSMPERERCFSIGWATFSGPVAVKGKRLEAAARSSAGKKKDE